MAFVGGRYLFATRADLTTAGFAINTDGNKGTRSIYPSNSSSYSYDTGRKASQFDNVRNIRAPESVDIRDVYSLGGWMVSRGAGGNGSHNYYLSRD